VAGGGARRRAAPLLPRLPGVHRGPARGRAPAGELPGLTGPTPDPARPRSSHLCEHDGMAARKGQVTRPTDASVAGFLAGVPDQRRREDAGRLCAMVQEVTGEPPAMWGTSIIGFGTYHYRYASGHE